LGKILRAELFPTLHVPIVRKPSPIRLYAVSQATSN
jgi:hypothetical protein